MIEPKNTVKFFILSTEFLYSQLVLTQEKCNSFYNLHFYNFTLDKENTVTYVLQEKNPLSSKKKKKEINPRKNYLAIKDIHH